MKIITVSSSAQDSRKAVTEIASEVKEKIGVPHLVLAYYTETHKSSLIQSEIKKQFPDAQILGCSSCDGTMTNHGYFQGHHISLWATSDENGDYGVSACNFHEADDIEFHTLNVLRQAIRQSDRPGELPALIVLHSTPGHEEAILKAIRKELGVNVPIIGGTAADNAILGKWSLFDYHINTSNGMAMAVFFPSAKVRYSFHSGYAPIERNAIATRLKGRTLLELDGEPAAQVYAKWYLEAAGEPLDNEHIFTCSSLYPLGRQKGEIHGIPYFSLSHPASVSKEGGINMFCTIEEGEKVHLMSGTKEMILSRASRVVDSANEHDMNMSAPIGGILIYCAGCMFHIKDKLQEIVKNMNVSMQNAPFICPFTFGEQGQFLGGEIAHGNLMISTVLFYKE